MVDIGQTLKEARLAKGYTLDDLQQITKIQKRYLIAIEEDKFNELPGVFYIKAFVRQYAETVGVNYDELADQLKEYLGEQADLKTPEITSRTVDRQIAQQIEAKPDKVNKFFSYLPTVIIVVVVIAILGSIYIVAWGNHTKNSNHPIEKTEKVAVSTDMSSAKAAKEKSEKAEKAKQEKAKKEKAKKAKEAKEKAAKAKTADPAKVAAKEAEAAKEKAEKAKAAAEKSEKAKADQAKSEKAESEKAKSEKAEAAKAKADKEKAEKTKTKKAKNKKKAKQTVKFGQQTGTNFTYNVQAPAESTIKLAAPGKTAWSSISVNGTTIWQGTLTSDQTHEVKLPKDAKQVVLKLGNSKGTEVSFNGKNIDFLKQNDTYIVRTLTLDLQNKAD